MAEAQRISHRNVCVAGDGKSSHKKSLARVHHRPAGREGQSSTETPALQDSPGEGQGQAPRPPPATACPHQPGLPAHLRAPKGQIIIGRESEARAPQRAAKIKRGGGSPSRFPAFVFLCWTRSAGAGAGAAGGRAWEQPSRVSPAATDPRPGPPLSIPQEVTSPRGPCPSARPQEGRGGRGAAWARHVATLCLPACQGDDLRPLGAASGPHSCSPLRVFMKRLWSGQVCPPLRQAGRQAGPSSPHPLALLGGVCPWSPAPAVPRGSLPPRAGLPRSSASQGSGTCWPWPCFPSLQGRKRCPALLPH